MVDDYADMFADPEHPVIKKAFEIHQKLAKQVDLDAAAKDESYTVEQFFYGATLLYRDCLDLVLQQTSPPHREAAVRNMLAMLQEIAGFVSMQASELTDSENSTKQ